MQNTSPPINETEKRILQAAESEFMAKGFAGARTTAIADAAGVTHAMLHYYFRTKASLFERIITEKMRTLTSAMHTLIITDNAPMPERLKKGIAHHFDFIAANRDLPLFLINEVWNHPENFTETKSQLAEIAQSLIANLQQQLDQSAVRGEIARVNAMHLILDIVSLNVFSFAGYPFLSSILSISEEEKESFFAARKAEAIATIINRLKPAEPCENS